jgi:hydrogenase expression/formation protein HypC
MCLGVPGQILDVIGDDPILRSGRVNFSGIVKEISLACVPEAQVGDWVLVHVGLALSKLDEDAAKRSLDDLAYIGELTAAAREAE